MSEFCVILSILSIIFPHIDLALADELNPGVYSSNSKPFQVPFSDWTAKWWQWLSSIPTSQQPFEDVTGEKCGVKQEGETWYLVASATTVFRHCSVPFGKAIIFPVLTTLCSYAEYPQYKTEEELRNCAISQNLGVENMKVTIDGQEVNQLDSYRVTTGLFNLTYDKNEPFVPVSTHNSQGVSDGWFVMLEPLKQGEHTIHWDAIQPAPSPDMSGGTEYHVTYYLTIK